MKIAKITDTEKTLPFDMNSFLATRGLVISNSGGGKSYAIRKILEETHGHVQHIVLDLEGEFSSLREKYDYILIGKGENVDVLIDIKTANLLARKLLELNVSAIIDVSELKKHERLLFVKRFLDSLVEAPKKLWHPCMVIIDEAHQFCPEGKSGKAESTSSVIDLMTRGRKRGMMGLLASQRPAKLNKDASAECNNKFIGRVSQDIDMKRCAEELGITSKEEMRKLRELEPGEFFCFGPALINVPTKIKIDEVQTAHPDLNQKIGFTYAPPTDKIKGMLAKLVDLPQKAEQELREKADFEKEIRSLKAQLGASRREAPSTNGTKEHLKTALSENEKLRSLLKKVQGAYVDCQKNLDKVKNQADANLKVLTDIKELANKKVTLTKAYRLTKNIQTETPDQVVPVNHHKAVGEVPLAKTPRPYFEYPDAENGDAPLSLCARKVLGFLNKNPEMRFTKQQIALITDYSARSGGFGSAISALNVKEYIHKNGDTISVNLDADFPDDILMDAAEYNVDSIKQMLGKCPREILEVLLDSPTLELSKEELAERTTTPYSPTSGGFGTAISKLNILDLIIKTNGRIKLNPKTLELM
ncbi:MAG: ATP-binding protein [bacterium]|nr:ATP-binding protein [bacterium]